LTCCCNISDSALTVMTAITYITAPAKETA
jgi:hypothetical protein